MTLADEIDEVEQELTQRRDEMVARADEHLRELAAMRAKPPSKVLDEETRSKLRLIRRRALGDEAKREAKTQPKGATGVRVHMRAPEGAPGKAPPTASVKSAPSRVVVQGTVQRQLGVIDGRLVTLMMTEEADGHRPAGEIYLLCDVRAGLGALLTNWPEHDVLLALVSDYAEQVEDILTDLNAGGERRARRLFDHDRELVSRLRATSKADPANKSLAAAVVKYDQRLDVSKKALAAAQPVAGVSRELEEMLMSMHKELDDQGFAGARSLLFSSLRRAGGERA